MSTLSVQSIKDVQSFDFANTTFANAYNVANAAFGKANSALANASGTFTGNLSVTGNVGIGTSSSTFNLDISGALRCLSSSEGIQTTGDTIGRDLLAGRSNVATCIGYAGGSAMVQGTNFSLSATPDLTLQPYGGNVGIGTASPAQKLEVLGSGDTLLRVTGGSANAKGVEFYKGSGSPSQIYNVSDDLRFWNNGINTLNIDSAGRVTMPYQPSFAAVDGRGFAAQAAGVVVWTVTNHNTGSHYNTSNGRFTAPIAGKYFFSAIIQSADTYNAGSPYISFYFRRNGTGYGVAEYVESVTSSGDHRNLSASHIIDLGVGDYVDVYASRGYRSGSQTSFCGYLIG